MRNYILEQQINFYFIGENENSLIAIIKSKIDFKKGELIFSSTFENDDNEDSVQELLDNIPIFEIENIAYSHPYEDNTRLTKFIYLKQYFGNL